MAFRLGWTRPTTAIETALQGQPLSIMEFESPSAAVIATPVTTASRMIIWWITGMIVMVILIGIYLPLDISIGATGKVVSTADTIVIQPLDTSIIKSFNAKLGQIVHKGDLLATLDDTLTAADTSAYKASVAELTPMMERLHAEQAGKTYVPKDRNDPNQMLQLRQFEQRRAQVAATLDQYNQQIVSLEQQISGNLAAARYYRERLGMASDVEQLRRQEEQLQVGSKLNSLLAADTRVQMEAGIESSVAAAESEKGTLLSTIGQRDSTIAEFNAATAQSISDNQSLLDTAKQNLDKATLHNGLVEMRAPADGIVLQINKLSIGSVLTTGEQLMQLTPLDKPLQVEAYVGGNDIGWVLPGDYAQIQFATFMYEEYGDAKGHITSIGVDSFISPSSSGTSNAPIISSTGGGGDPATALPQATTMTPNVSVFYVVQCSIDRLQLRNVPKDFRMIPGMPVNLAIKVGVRSYISYIFARVMTTMHEAMREP